MIEHIGDDIIDSRDLQAELERIEGEIEVAEEAGSASEEARIELDNLRAELAILREAKEEMEGYAGESWEDGVTMVHDRYFIDYAQELADDIGAIDAKASWPNSCIDWDRAARELQMDYTEIEIQGESYWYR
jgi:hypothetical protein